MSIFVVLSLFLLISTVYPFSIFGDNKRSNAARVFAGLDNKNSDEGLLYDDFDFPVGGDNVGVPSSSGNAKVLQDRLNHLVATEQRMLQQISENWREGHWSVRGCSLDPGDAGFGEKKIEISALLALPGDDAADEIVLVGRTDGSVCWLQIGSEYLATFTNQYVARETSNETITVQQELKRDESASVPMPMSTRESEENAAAALSDQAKTSFEILGQVQVSTSAIVDMAIAKTDSSGGLLLYILTQSPTQPVQYLEVREDGPVSSQASSIPVYDADPRPSPIGAIKAIRNRFCLAVSQLGTISTWLSERGDTCSLVGSFSMPVEDDDSVLCCDVDANFVYVGTSNGFVYMYAIDKILEETYPEPMRVVGVFAKGGVSSVCAAGEGVMGKGRPTPTVALVTGSTHGEIKQWELLPRGLNALEYWPKIPSQKIAGKAHLLVQGDATAAGGASPGSAILALRKVQEGVLLSATGDKLVIWDTVTGKPHCDMHGLNFDLKPCCLVLSERLLVTNGMQQYICVHDFTIDPNIAIQDMIQHMDDEDE